jgi:hypothetical protein
MRLTIAVVGAVLAATLTFVAAGSPQREPVAARESGLVAPAPPPGVTIVNAQIYRGAQVYRGGPHIIHVPQADDPDERVNSRRASINRRAVPQATIDDDDDEPAPPPHRRVAPDPQPQSDIPPRSHAPRWQLRTIQSAPPPPMADGPTPIRPIPRFDAKTDPAGKFAQPRDARLGAPPPSEPGPPTEVRPDRVQ